MKNTPDTKKRLILVHDKLCPKCTTQADYDEWRQTYCRYETAFAGFCSDCTPNHQMRMHRLGKCEYYRMITFGNSTTDDGVIGKVVRGSWNKFGKEDGYGPRKVKYRDFECSKE